MYVYASNNAAAGTLQVDWARVAAYTSGSLAAVSCAKDGGAAVTWATASWIATTPAGTSVTVETRTSADAVSWSAWNPVTTNGGAITSPAGRYLQYRVTLSTTDALVSPRVDQVTITKGT
jgi:hypothetical protein